MFSGEQQGNARHYHFPSCFAIACPWNYSPKAVSLKEAVKGAANDPLSANT